MNRLITANLLQYGTSKDGCISPFVIYCKNAYKVRRKSYNHLMYSILCSRHRNSTNILYHNKEYPVVPSSFHSASALYCGQDRDTEYGSKCSIHEYLIFGGRLTIVGRLLKLG